MVDSSEAISNSRSDAHDTIHGDYLFKGFNIGVGNYESIFKDPYIAKIYKLSIFKSIMSLTGYNDPLIDRSIRDSIIMWSNNMASNHGMILDLNLALKIWDSYNGDLYNDPELLDLALYIADSISQNKNFDYNKISTYIEYFLRKLNIDLHIDPEDKDTHTKIYTAIYIALVKSLKTE